MVTAESPEHGAEWEKTVSGAAEKPYLFLDNVRGRLDSTVLARFLTSREWSWRPLGTNQRVEAKVDIQVVVTGNNVEVSDDLERRSIFIHLV
jgi:hypothetical protein